MAKLFFHLLVWFIVLHTPLPEAEGLVIYGGGSADDLGMYMAEVTFFPYTDTEAEITVVLANLSRPGHGAHITGFALANPGGRVEHIAPASDFPQAFKIFGNTRRSAPRAGLDGDEFGAALAKGMPAWMDFSNGLPPDDAERAAMFRFYLTGRGLYTLTEMDFVPAAGGIRPVELSGPREGSCYFAVRVEDHRNGGERIVGRASYWSQ